VVIGEGWPAWLPILPSLGARVVALIDRPGFEDENLEGVARLEVGSEGAIRFLEKVPHDMLIFVSGSSVFIHNLAGELAEKTRVVIALDSGNRITSKLRETFPGMNWTRVNHAEVGGVTSARNWIGSSGDIEMGRLEISPYQRVIGEVIKPTLKGQFGKARAGSGSGQECVEQLRAESFV
jgi:hypothetical protein